MARIKHTPLKPKIRVPDMNLDFLKSLPPRRHDSHSDPSSGHDLDEDQSSMEAQHNEELPKSPSQLSSSSTVSTAETLPSATSSRAPRPTILDSPGFDDSYESSDLFDSPRSRSSSSDSSSSYEAALQDFAPDPPEEQPKPMPTIQNAPERIDDDVLAARFGGTAYYAESFINYNSQLARTTFAVMDSIRSASDERYEAARQKFLKMYGMHKGRWHATSQTTDRYVSVSRISHADSSSVYEYLAFMRVKPHGFRGERSVPSHMEMTLHLLVGKVGMTYRKRLRHMNRGDHIHIVPNSTFSLKCLSSEQEAIFVFGVALKI